MRVRSRTHAAAGLSRTARGTTLTHTRWKSRSKTTRRAFFARSRIKMMSAARPRAQELRLRNMAGGVWFVNAVVSTRPTLPLIITPGFDIIKTTHVEEGEDEVPDEPVASVFAGHLLLHSDDEEYAVLWGAIRHDPVDDEDSR